MPSAKPRIGMDARMLFHTGIGTYIRGLLGGICETGGHHRADWTLYGPPELPGNLNCLNAGSFDAPIYSFQEQLRYPPILRECDLWHAPHYNVPLIRGSCRVVVTIHDLIHWIFRKDYFTPLQAVYAKVMLQQAVKTSRHVITVSENTRQDLIKHFLAAPEKISVIPEAVDPVFRPVEDTSRIEDMRQRRGLPEKYFLYVGSLKPHKNVLWLVRLFRRLRTEGKVTAALVLIGKKDRKYAAPFQELGGLESDGGILHLEDMTQDDLILAYNGALALVHPSRYEGFGLTLLEAMACGTPVIASRAASIPEVTGEDACLVDSCSDHGMMQAIIQMESSASLRRDLRQRGIKRAGLFSWRETARQTMDVYEKVLAQSR